MVIKEIEEHDTCPNSGKEVEVSPATNSIVCTSCGMRVNLIDLVRMDSKRVVVIE